MIHTTTSVEIDRPSAEVFAFLADASNNPRWQRGMRSAGWTSEPPVGIGSTYDQVAEFLGRRIESTFEVVDFEEGRSITITSTSGTFPITVTRMVEPLGEDRCRASAEVAGDASGVFRIATPLLRAMVRRSVSGDYARLKEMLETT